MNKLIYLDNAATTKPSETAINENMRFNTVDYFNASALYHGGVQNKKELNNAKETLKRIVGENFEVIFTSCGSESDNTAVFSYTKRGNAVTTLGEHSAIHVPFSYLKENGYDSRFAKLNLDGSVNIEDLLSKIDEKTVFCSVVHVNNETGAVNDINLIAKLVKEKNPRVIFHSDGVQAFMKIPYKLSSDIDLYSASAHKINGLKGVGALFVNKKIHNLKPLIFGGGQENGLRSGTENLFGIKIFESVTKEHFDKIYENYDFVSTLKEKFVSKLDKDIFKIISGEKSSPYILLLSAVGLRGEVIEHKMEEYGLVIGTGSACSSRHKYSRMLTEIGFNENVLGGVLRISFCPENTMEEVEYSVEKLNLVAKELKRIMNV